MEWTSKPSLTLIVSVNIHVEVVLDAFEVIILPARSDDTFLDLVVLASLDDLSLAFTVL